MIAKINNFAIISVNLQISFPLSIAYKTRKLEKRLEQMENNFLFL